MGKRETSGAQRAEKKKKRSAKGGAGVGPSQGSSTGGVSGPVPVRKIPSLRGKHQVGLYAAGSFQNAPSPRRLPQPPSKWMRDAARASSSDAAMMPPPQPVLRRESSVVAELQGNLLYLTLSPRFPDLAGKLTGMLLELGADDMKEILGSEGRREAAVQEALEVLREAGDERAVRALKQPAAQPQAPPGLMVDIGAAHAAQAADGSTGLTPSVTGLMRMSPRVSSNPFLSANLLRGHS